MFTLLSKDVIIACLSMIRFQRWAGRTAPGLSALKRVWTDSSKCMKEIQMKIRIHHASHYAGNWIDVVDIKRSSASLTLRDHPNAPVQHRAG
jgi:hypothetical protein